MWNLVSDWSWRLWPWLCQCRYSQLGIVKTMFHLGQSSLLWNKRKSDWLWRVGRRTGHVYFITSKVKLWPVNCIFCLLVLKGCSVVRDSADQAVDGSQPCSWEQYKTGKPRCLWKAHPEGKGAGQEELKTRLSLKPVITTNILMVPGIMGRSSSW